MSKQLVFQCSILNNAGDAWGILQKNYEGTGDLGERNEVLKISYITLTPLLKNEQSSREKSKWFSPKNKTPPNLVQGNIIQDVNKIWEKTFLEKYKKPLLSFL